MTTNSNGSSDKGLDMLLGLLALGLFFALLGPAPKPATPKQMALPFSPPLPEPAPAEETVAA